MKEVGEILEKTFYSKGVGEVSDVLLEEEWIYLGKFYKNGSYKGSIEIEKQHTGWYSWKILRLKKSGYEEYCSCGRSPSLESATKESRLKLFEDFNLLDCTKTPDTLEKDVH